jgi:CBS domain-containing protein
MTRAPDTVGEVMTREVVAVSPDDDVERAVRSMIDHEIGAVVVLEGKAPVGILTERDLMRRMLDERDVLSVRVDAVMSSPVVTTGPDVEMVDAFDLMNARNVRRLPVVERDGLVGIVTERDLLRWVSAVAAE